MFTGGPENNEGENHGDSQSDTAAGPPPVHRRHLAETSVPTCVRSRVAGAVKAAFKVAPTLVSSDSTQNQYEHDGEKNDSRYLSDTHFSHPYDAHRRSSSPVAEIETLIRPARASIAPTIAGARPRS